MGWRREMIFFSSNDCELFSTVLIRRGINDPSLQDYPCLTLLTCTPCAVFGAAIHLKYLVFADSILA